jgi:hypothetical protein
MVVRRRFLRWTDFDTLVTKSVDHAGTLSDLWDARTVRWSRHAAEPSIRLRGHFLVQQALVQKMNPIFAPLFADCSFGYRPGRSPHMAMRKVAGNPRGPGLPTSMPPFRSTPRRQNSGSNPRWQVGRKIAI